MYYNITYYTMRCYNILIGGRANQVADFSPGRESEPARQVPTGQSTTTHTTTTTTTTATTTTTTTTTNSNNNDTYTHNSNNHNKHTNHNKHDIYYRQVPTGQ